MKRYFMVLVVLICSICFVKNVKGEGIKDYILKKYDKVPDTYITEIGSERIRYDYFYLIARDSDKNHLYCIEPGKSIDESVLYDGYQNNLSSYANLTDDELELVKLYAYYGYGYYGHASLGWYAATQYLIWNVKDFGVDIYFTDKLQGNRINKYTLEMRDIKKLVSEHYKKPNFNTNYEISLGDKITINDTNNILSEYVIDSYQNNISVSKYGNSLTIEGIKDGTSEIVLKRKFNKYGFLPTVYVGDNTQTVISNGNLDDITMKINVRVNGGKLVINKYDKDSMTNKTQGDASLSGAIYDVYDDGNNYLLSLTTNSNGYAESDKVFKVNTNYYLKERVASRGYLVDENKYTFCFDKNSLVTTIHSYEQIIKAKVNLYKVYENVSSGVMSGEPYIRFNIYNKSTGLYYNYLVTNSKGKADIVLPYGVWTFKQVNTSNGYLKAEPFDVVIDNTNDIDKIVSNNIVTTKLKVINLDYDSNNIIKRDGIKFKIKNLDTGSYVCHNVSYPNQDTICEYSTKNGYFITPNNLKFGNYELEQVDQKIDGFVWNKNKIKFSINQNSNIIKDNDVGNIIVLNYYNKMVKGEVLLTKYGEEENIIDGIINYDKILLNDVGFSLYAKEDIFDGVGNLIYKKDSLVKKIKIDKGKYNFTDLYLGKYYLVEDYTDINHIKDDEKYYFSLDYKNQYTSIVKLNIERNNYLRKGSIEINKKDYKNKYGIYNTKLELHIENGDKDILVGQYSTDINGKVIVNNIPIKYGYKYYIKEIQPSTGYILNSDKIYFEFKNDNNVSIDIYNKKYTGILDLVVVDKDTDMPIKNALIVVKDELGNVVYRDYTDSDGRIYVEDIEYGKYKVMQEEGIDDFIKDDNIYSFNIDDNNKYFRLKIYNYRNKKNDNEVNNNNLEEKDIDDDINNNMLLSNSLDDNVSNIEVPNTNKNKILNILNVNYLILIIILFSVYRELKYVIINKK